MSALMRYFFNWKLMPFVLPVLYAIFRSYRLYLGQLEREKIYAQEMAALHLRTIEALALAIETKDHTTGTHLRRVQIYAREIGKDLKLNESEMRALQAASILHDVGKLAVPDYIISKPGKLTPEEFDKMKIHPVVGAEIVATIDFPYPVEPIVRCHHEKWDGSGYPDGVRGTDIPLGARILSCVDCFDALASDRQYRKAMPLDKAIEVVKSEAGKAFDPAVVDVLARRYLELEQLAVAEPVVEGAKAVGGRQSNARRRTRRRVPKRGCRDSRRGKGRVRKLVWRRDSRNFTHFANSPRMPAPRLSLEDTLVWSQPALRVWSRTTPLPFTSWRERRLSRDYVNGENHKLFSTLRIPMGEGLSGWVAENRKPILNGNPSVEPGYLHDPSKFSTLRSALGIPIETASGIIGVIGIYKAEKDGFSRDHLRAVLAINLKLSMVVETALRHEKSRNEAATDSTHKLPGAASLFLHLDKELALRPAAGNAFSRCGLRSRQLHAE